jgi:hypothetical protein
VATVVSGVLKVSQKSYDDVRPPPRLRHDGRLGREAAERDRPRGRRDAPAAARSVRSLRGGCRSTVAAAATAASVGMASGVGSDAAPLIQADPAARLEDRTKLLPAALHAALHARQGQADSSSGLVLRRSLEIDQANRLLRRRRQSREHRRQTGSQLSQRRNIVVIGGRRCG